MEQTEMVEKVHKLYTDMYLGEGKDNPPITVRVALNEEAIKTISSNIIKGLWLLAASVMAGFGNLILHMLHL